MICGISGMKSKYVQSTYLNYSYRSERVCFSLGTHTSVLIWKYIIINYINNMLIHTTSRIFQLNSLLGQNITIKRQKQNNQMT